MRSWYETTSATGSSPGTRANTSAARSNNEASSSSSLLLRGIPVITATAVADGTDTAPTIVNSAASSTCDASGKASRAPTCSAMRRRWGTSAFTSPRW